ncbi:MAG: hypothetical protein Q4C45_09330 [Oscillospiraceae bacterium]|nr:hypothetical protein [Oscillospiraceae bacterium]
MNGRDLLEALGQVDGALVEAAESRRPCRRPRPWLLAACICLVLAGTACAVGTLWGVQIGELSTGEEESSYSVYGTVRTVPDANFSQELHQILEDDWADWWAKSLPERMLSSTLPGAPYREYETWVEGTAFLGVEPANPLEEADWLERAASDGTLEGAQMVMKHCRVSFRGNENGRVETASLRAGYRSGDIRVTLRVELRTEYAGETAGDGSQDIETGAVWPEAVNMTSNSFAMPDGQAAALVISQPRREDSYVSIDAYFIRDGLLYSLDVVGPDGGDEAVAAVRAVLEQALNCFE